VGNGPLLRQGARSASLCSVAGRFDGRGTAISSLARAMFALQVVLARSYRVEKPDCEPHCDRGCNHRQRQASVSSLSMRLSGRPDKFGFR
jgi:hypothetical protein